MSTLSTLHQEVEKKQLELEGDLVKIDQEISNSHNNMQQHPYYLHSILVHEGTGEMGHYYSFIFDRSAHKWYRFNDYKVSEETEDRVFEESFGD
jgi:ubiquitin C-terminal hydrolase